MKRLWRSLSTGLVTLALGQALAAPPLETSQAGPSMGHSNADRGAGETSRQGRHSDHASGRSVAPGERSERPLREPAIGRDGSGVERPGFDRHSPGVTYDHRRHDDPRQPSERVDENGVRFITAPPSRANTSREDGWNRPDAVRRGDERPRWERSGPNDLNRDWDAQRPRYDHPDYDPNRQWDRDQWSGHPSPGYRYDRDERHGWGPYPDRRPGFIVRGIPPGFARIRHRDREYFYADGYWYSPYGGKYVVVSPPRGLYINVLPYFTQTLVIGGLTYYFVAGNYYLPQSGGGYVVVDPPIQSSGYAATGNAYDVVAYPARGQSQAQLEQDRYDCYRWAANESGFDPARAKAAVVSDQVDRYRRAMGACLSGKGYSVAY
ncbi:hypothetical protein IQ22_02137 [Pseudomonas duriflava]|uniref:Glycine zipper family protein n=1 Tax=Pseudomonas duriflava TaxID=459528 RepID=A0A562QC21_9PSED|nr:DUF6515 family protein [Pseudomonas duriflava]TWI54274.1 hypothetical protein IQ22_02137 [Pseudomonas duriflava]